MKALRQQIRLMAPTNGRVLIYGESGTGKELIAGPSTPKACAAIRFLLS
jgi:DNA-binding NtrC family response regulator